MVKSTTPNYDNVRNNPKQTPVPIKTLVTSCVKSTGRLIMTAIELGNATMVQLGWIGLALWLTDTVRLTVEFSKSIN